jgi:hypothetical protein
LATNLKAQLVIGLTQKDEDLTARLMSFARRPNDGFVLRETRSVLASGGAWLSPVITHHGHHVALWTGEEIQLLSGAALVPITHWEPQSVVTDIPFVAGLLLASQDQETTKMAMLLLGAGNACYLKDFSTDFIHLPRLGWTPSVSEGSTLVLPHLAYLRTNFSELELAGIAQDGCLYWSRLRLQEDGRADVTTICTRGCEASGYSATAIIRPGLVAGVKKNCVEWLTCGAKAFSKRNPFKIDLPSTVACFPHYRSNELILIGREGSVGRIPISA